MIAKQAKSFAVELSDPALQWNLPDRMPPEKPRDEPDTHGLVRCGWSRHRRVRIALRDQPAPERAIDCLQAPIVPALMRQVIGRMASKAINQVGQSAAFDVVAERLQILLEARALTVHLLIARIE